MLQTGRLYDEQISRHIFLGLDWTPIKLANGQYTPTFIQKPAANTSTP